jgi:hypothetical protein
MREFRTYGSVRGAAGNSRPYREVRQAWRVAPLSGAGNRKAKADREVT